MCFSLLFNVGLHSNVYTQKSPPHMSLQVLLAPPCLQAFSFTSTSYMGLLYTIHENHVSTQHAHTWELTCISMFMGLTPYLDLATLALRLCWTFFQYCFCGPFRLCFGPANCRRELEHLTTLPHTTMGSAEHHGESPI